nr:reverse transcriptase domain-containing protein [Tanacetum cinerariifolium]
MSVMANTTPIVTTVTETATKEKTSNGAEAAPRANILDFCEEHYEDILPVMDKIRRDKRKKVHTRLDFGENSKKSRRMREDSQNSSAKTLSTRYRNPSKSPQIRDHLRYNDGNVFGRLGHRRQSAFKRLSDTYSRSTTKSETDREYSRSSSKQRPLSQHRRIVDPFTPRIRNFKSSRKTRMPNNVKIYDGTGDPEDHVRNFQAAAQVERWVMPTWCHMFNSTLIGTAMVWFDELPLESIDGYKDLKVAFLAYFMQQQEYVKDPLEIHNIKQKDGETIEDIIKRFKCLNEHVPKTIEEMMTVTTAFIRGETAAAFKKKGRTSWEPQDQPKRHVSERRSDFRGQSREGQGSNRFTLLTRTPKEILAAEAGTFKLPPPMVTQGTEGPLAIEAEIRGHMIHHMYVDGGDANHSTKAWMNFMVVRSLSPYNGIIKRPRIREIQAVPSTAHVMLKFPVDGGILTICSTILIPAECLTVTTSSKEIVKEVEVRPENLKIALHPNFPDQEVAIGRLGCSVCMGESGGGDEK